MAFKFFGRKKVGLALSGGGARGFAHIGVIKALHDHRIPIDYIAGTSVGSLIGALYAGGLNITTMLEISSKVKWKNFFKIVLSKSGLVSSEEIEKFIISQIGRKTFADLVIPFCTIAADLKTGQEIVMNKGEVHKAVRASCNFPWMYIPIKSGHQLLVDGVLGNNLPIDQVKKMGADFVIGVDVIPKVEDSGSYANVLEIFDRALDLFIINQTKNKRCDVMITPVTKRITSLELDKADMLIKMGEEATKKAIPAINKGLNSYF